MVAAGSRQPALLTSHGKWNQELWMWWWRPSMTHKALLVDGGRSSTRLSRILSRRTENAIAASGAAVVAAIGTAVAAPATAVVDWP
ncbi:hypothetical protein F0562_001689 [Nyssa sinensis]|uniref:Uncharacterized protein n=1 Tax=Nyssa sinensis TaxID=561372 RepID=A0A5J5C3S4_9ASTE|nr:hypothetical protein F0562_001689 [Nyssa sinensis]